MNEKDIIQAFRDTGSGIKAFGSIEDAYQWLDGQAPTSLPCCYGGTLHYVSPETCEHHIEVKAPECMKWKCERVFSEQSHPRVVESRGAKRIFRHKGKVFSSSKAMKPTSDGFYRV